jgi:hypothetical protein
LKAQLKQYDMNFARKHGRMPVKAEKEPIRHLYENYNSLKSEIQRLEAEGRSSASTTQSSSLSSLPQRALSPPGSDGGMSGGEEGSGKSSPMPGRNMRKLPKPASPPIGSATSSGAPPSQDLAALKAEKSQLHQMLRAYEKEFFRENRRQVSSFADIRPVASQYRRYKEIKRNLAALQKERNGSDAG